MDNATIANRLSEVADLLEIQGANPFRIRAYRNAVRTVEGQTTPLVRMRRRGSRADRAARHRQGDGEPHRRAVRDRRALRARRDAPARPGDPDRPHAPPRRRPEEGAEALGRARTSSTVDELEEAAKAGKVAELAGFGAKSEAKILDGHRGVPAAPQPHAALRGRPAGRAAGGAPARSARRSSAWRSPAATGAGGRRSATSTCWRSPPTPAPVMERFLAYTHVARVEMSGPTRASVVLGSGLQVDLRVMPPESYGAALVYFTGSKEHNIRLRQRALERRLRVSEWGVFREEGGQGRRPEKAHERDPLAGERVAGAEEEDVYAARRPAVDPARAARGPGRDRGGGGRASSRAWSSSTTSAATSRCTRPGPTARTRSRRWSRPAPRAATPTWRSPTTRSRSR